MSHLWTRRALLGRGLAAAAGFSSPGAMMGLLGAATAGVAQAASTDYKALVCVYLAGGNDGYNMLVPRDDARYATYKAARRSLALTQSDLLPLAGDSGDSNTYGLHPAMPELQALYQSRQLALVANVGTLLQPTTRADVVAERHLPANLYSHKDQRDSWMASDAGSALRLGWAGRLADLYGSVNANRGLSMNLSLAGVNLLQVGDTTLPYALKPSGVQQLRAFNVGGARGRARLAAFEQVLALTQGGLAIESFAGTLSQRAMDLGVEVGEALARAPQMSTAFPDSGLGEQLAMVAKLISVRGALGMSRQVFYVSLDGFDTHDDQLESHPELLAQVSQAVAAFHGAITELGVQEAVTTFTASDFGRTLASNGDGSDHAWGNVHWVMGGAVRGGSLYGRYPELRIDGNDDAGNGRLIPTTSVEEYAAPLLRWFGATESIIDVVLPKLPRFATRGLGFM